ncbi:four helix bundle protein [Cruoricaptor ignavus]|uniref:four helix bundle protein n=1 Tax=Cruoricaptor ignavus TaxID=1118202 RepID=UPI00293BED84|nr:four helix bundle protein [Cruoricaptor ignavus]
MIKQIYLLSKSFPKEEQYNITSQIRRAALSIPINIAEGCGRNTDKEFNQFLNIALGSASETEYLIILCSDLEYFTEDESQLLLQQINVIKSKIFNLKEKLKPHKA